MQGGEGEGLDKTPMIALEPMECRFLNAKCCFDALNSKHERALACKDLNSKVRMPLMPNAKADKR